MRADLHMHSVYSDGKKTPQELIEIIHEKGLDVVALTDHDSYLGIPEFELEAKKYGIRVIRGAEISSNIGSHPVHILTYFKGEIPSQVHAFCQEVKEKRRARALKMAHLLESEFNLKINFAKLEAFKGNLTRGNLYYAILEDNDVVDSQETFDKYLSSSSPAYIPSTEATPKEVYDFFRGFKCLIVIAHPMLYKKEVVDEIINYGFDGLEAYYPNYKYENEEYFLNLAKEHNMFVTAGSDFHKDDDHKHAPIATSTLSGENLEIFLERLERL